MLPWSEGPFAARRRTLRNLSSVPELTGGDGPLGHLGELRQDPMALLQRAADADQPLLRLRTPVGVALLVASPELFHEVLVERSRTFVKSYVMEFALRPIGGDGLFLSDGELWRRQRKTMAPMFQPQRLKSYLEPFAQLSERWSKTLVDGQRLLLADELSHLTMRIAGKTLFGAESLSAEHELAQALTIALEWSAGHAPSVTAVGHALGRLAAERLAARSGGPAQRVLRRAARRLQTPLVWPGREGAKMRDAIGRLDAEVERLIEGHARRQEPRDDLLARLLEARDEHGQPLSKKQVRDEILTLFVAGHETTATALAWTLYELSRAPHWRRQIEAEIEALGRAPGPEDLPRLPLTLAAFKESMRLYPPVFGFGRQLLQPGSLAGLELESMTLAFMAPLVMQRRASLYPDPLRFDPSRFLPEQEAQRARFAWVPFGGGPRVCIGQQFALLEGPMVLATIMHRARFVAEGDIAPEPKATLRPAAGLPMRVELRRPVT